jgi:hypothetical protein
MEPLQSLSTTKTGLVREITPLITLGVIFIVAALLYIVDG